MEPMFDKDSFTDEITDAKEANSAVLYLSHNERNFQEELINEGLTYDQIEAEIATVWGNLLKSCKRVGFSDHATEARAKLYGTAE
jgi:hypothetical protein